MGQLLSLESFPSSDELGVGETLLKTVTSKKGTIYKVLSAPTLPLALMP